MHARLIRTRHCRIGSMVNVSPLHIFILLFITLIEALSKKKNLDLSKVECVSAEGASDTHKASECEQWKLQGLFPD